MKISTKKLLLLIFFMSSFSAFANEHHEFNSDLNFAQVQYVTLNKLPNNNYRISVQVRHHDQGWDHYADLWQVVDANTDKVLGERVLLHPHDNEQPFTRSISSLNIPISTKKLFIRAKCNQHGFEGKEVLVDLNIKEAPDYIIK